MPPRKTVAKAAGKLARAGAGTKRPSVKKSGRKSDPERKPAKGGELVPQPHGGAIRRGSAEGNTPGTGRPPSAIRRRAALLFDKGLDAVMGPAIDGRIRVVLGFEDDEALADVLYTEFHHAAAGPDESRFTPWDQLPPGERRPWIVAAGRARQSHKKPEHLILEASLAERNRAMDILGKYGIGQRDEVTVVHPDVQHRLGRQADVILGRETWTREELLAALDQVWS